MSDRTRFAIGVATIAFVSTIIAELVLSAIRTYICR